MKTRFSFAATLVCSGIVAGAEAAEVLKFRNSNVKVDKSVFFGIANGTHSHHGVAIWNVALASVSSAETEQALAVWVGVLPADNFKALSPPLQDVTDGKLRIPEQSSAAAGLLEARDVLEVRFFELVALLRDGADVASRPVRNAVDAVRAALEVWHRRSAATTIERERYDVDQFQWRLTTLLDRVQNSNGEAYVDFLRDGGHQFAGGSVGDMIRWSIAHQASVRPGTEAHAYFLAAARALCDELFDEDWNEETNVALHDAKKPPTAVAARPAASTVRTGASSTSRSTGYVATPVWYRPGPTYYWSPPTTRKYTVRYYYVYR